MDRWDLALGPESCALGILGMTGITAYVGMRLLGRPKPGDTVRRTALGVRVEPMRAMRATQERRIASHRSPFRPVSTKGQIRMNLGITAYVQQNAAKSFSGTQPSGRAASCVVRSSSARHPAAWAKWLGNSRSWPGRGWSQKTRTSLNGLNTF